LTHELSFISFKEYMGEVGITILLASCKQPLSNETIAVQ
jgi:hypothetical protein